VVRIIIGNVEKDLDSVSERWINQTVNQRRDDNQPVCVKVIITEKPSADIILSSADCGSGGGGGRKLTDKEQNIVGLWGKLVDNGFRGGHVIAFLKQLRKIL
jgi:hypothetical protein